MQPQQAQDGKWYIQQPNGSWQEVAAPQAAAPQFAAPQFAAPQFTAPPPQQYAAQQPAQGGGWGASQPDLRTPGGFPSQQGNPFVNLGNADPSGGTRLPYFLVGNYQLEVQRVKMQESRKGKLQLILESLILASDNPERPAGMKCSAFIDLSNADTRDGHVKRLICAVQGANHEDPRWKGQQAPDGRTWEQVMWEAVDETNPWHGRKLGCEVTTIDLKNGDEWTLHSWVAFDQVRLIQRAPAALAQNAAALAQHGDMYMRPGVAPQGAVVGNPPGHPPQNGTPPGFAPQGLPPQQPQQPTFAPQGGPPGFQPQGPGFQPQGPGPQQPRPGFQGGAFPPHGS